MKVSLHINRTSPGHQTCTFFSLPKSCLQMFGHTEMGAKLLCGSRNYGTIVTNQIQCLYILFIVSSVIWFLNRPSELVLFIFTRFSCFRKFPPRIDKPAKYHSQSSQQNISFVFGGFPVVKGQFCLKTIGMITMDEGIFWGFVPLAPPLMTWICGPQKSEGNPKSKRKL